MTTFNTGAYPPGCTQRDVDMAAQDPFGFVPRCDRCDDQGCLECCPPEPVTLDDLDQIDDEIAEAEGIARVAATKAAFAALHDTTMEMLAEPLDSMRGVEFPFAENH